MKRMFHVKHCETISPRAAAGAGTRRWLSAGLCAYVLVVLALTMFKGYFAIGRLWRTEVHHVRAVEWMPFDELLRAPMAFTTLFGYVGNIGLFLPLGVLVFSLLQHHGIRHPLRRTVLISAAASLSIEVTQYILANGYSDIDDLMCNTFGGFLGALLAQGVGPRGYRLWGAIGVLLLVAFGLIVLVA